jgi:hypothetical protein
MLPLIKYFIKFNTNGTYQMNNKWQISEVLELKNNRQELFVFKPITRQEILAKESLRTLMDTDDMKFSMVYLGSKMLGYHFEFTTKMSSPLYMNDRTAVMMFDGKKKAPQVNVIFEDQVIRLLSYEQENRKPDYWLVGRWRY